MMASAPRARSRLFDWLSGAQCPAPNPHALGPEEWLWIDETAKAYRLAPILHRRARDHDAICLPADLAEHYARAFNRQHMRWLTMQRGMVRVSAALADAGIAHVFLKGAALCLATYSEPAVRPLRDLDILVHTDDARSARDILSGLGFESLAGDVAAALAHGYQLPAMVDRRDRLTVEVHHALAAVAAYDSRPLADYMLESARTVLLAGRQIPISAPDATFLHLALHAGPKSLFDCGPLVLADIAALIEAHPHELKNLVQTARRYGLLRPIGILTHLLRRHGNAADMIMSQGLPDVPGTLLDHAEKLLVQPLGSLRKRQMKRTATERGVPAAMLAAVRKAFKPSRAGIAAMSGGRSKDNWLWLRYPTWLWQRGRQFLTGLGDRKLSEETHKDLALAQYLVSDPREKPL